MSEHPRYWFATSAGLLDKKHVRAMGPAIWVFLYLISMERRPKTGEISTGEIDGGREITYQEVAAHLGIPFGTVRKYVALLESGNYIRAERKRRGLCFWIVNPLRWTFARVSAGEHSNCECPPESTHNSGLECPPESTHEGIRTKEQDIRTNSKPSGTDVPGGVDSRHSPIRELIQKSHQEIFGIACEWDGSEAKALAKILSANPSWTVDQISSMVRNRFASDVNGERPRRWLGRISDYIAGPLDRFNRVIDTRPRFQEGMKTDAAYA